jgi:ABC-type multidrug transport system ATPase subunit
MTQAISVAGLSRGYRGQLALDRVGFEVASGSITGLVGRNGAGKTMLLRILAGQEFPSTGRVLVLGANPQPLGAARGRVAGPRWSWSAHWTRPTMPGLAHYG